jgi:deferrochelatase/peroxidase EfeB
MNPTMIGLDDVQGNILKGHGRKYSALVMFRFGSEQRLNRAMLRDSTNPAKGHAITTAAQQQVDAARHRLRERRRVVQEEAGRFGGDPPFRSLLLTAAGMVRCGIPQGEVNGGTTDWADFWNGMSRESLADPEPWVEEYRVPPDGAWLIAHASETTLKAMVEQCQNWLAEGYRAEVFHVEWGFRWDPCDHQVGHEPFGFADGFTPVRVAAHHRGFIGWLRAKVERIAFWFQRANVLPEEQILIRAPAELAGSSFLVLRKLEQNVQAFSKAEMELARQIEALAPNKRPRCKDAGALLVGRERDGTPLVEGGRARMTRFSFQRDDEGRGCPFHAHIRKMNPRQDFDGHGNRIAATRAEQLRRQFMRRGVVYGDEDRLRLRWHNPENAPAAGVGLLFIGYMSDIGGQFVEIHRHWALVHAFPSGKDEGADPMFEPGAAAKWRWSAEPALSVELKGRLVTPKGGVYFLVPCLTWLARQ